MDFKAAVITLFVVSFVVGTLLLITWRYDKKSAASAIYWAVAFYFVCAGFAVSIFDTVRPLAWFLILDLCLISSPVFMLAGVLTRMKRDIPWPLFIGSTVVVILTQYSLAWLEFDQFFRIISLNLIITIIHTVAGVYALKSNLGRQANIMLASGIFVVAFISGFRVVAGLISGHDIFALDGDYRFYYFVILTIAIITEAFTCISVLLVDKIDHITQQAITDSLTNCLNRRGFRAAASTSILQSKRGDANIVILMADLDKFKQTNDNFGHDVGDNTIKAFADLLHAEVRTTDFVGRMGGDEFILMLWQSDLSGAGDLIKRINKQLLNANIEGLPENFEITSSFGATIVEKDETELDPIFKRADLALYKAKHSGRAQLQSLLRDELDHQNADIANIAVST